MLVEQIQHSEGRTSMTQRQPQIGPDASSPRVDELARRKSQLTTRLLASGVAGGFGFPAVILALGAVREDYSALHQPGSMLSLGEGGWMQIANFVVSGLLVVAGAVGLRRALQPGRGAVWGPLLLAICGVGHVIAGVFIADPSYGYPPGAPLGPAASLSVHGVLHEVGGIVMFGPLLAACFVFAGRYAGQPGRRGWVVYSLLTALVIIASVAGAFRAWSSGMQANFGGVFQRMALFAGWTWIALLARDILRETKVGRVTS